MSAFTPSLVQTEAEPAPTIRIRPWADEVIDSIGHDPPSRLLRDVLAGHHRAAASTASTLPTWPTRSALGHLGDVAAKNAPLRRGVEHGDQPAQQPRRGRAISRLCHFGLCHTDPDGTIAVRRRVPPLNQRQVSRLLPTLRGAHDAWQARQLRGRTNGFGEA